MAFCRPFATVEAMIVLIHVSNEVEVPNCHCRSFQLVEQRDEVIGLAEASKWRQRIMAFTSIAIGQHMGIESNLASPTHMPLTGPEPSN